MFASKFRERNDDHPIAPAQTIEHSSNFQTAMSKRREAIYCRLADGFLFRKDGQAGHGAGRLGMFRFITLPMMRPFIVIAVLLRTVDAFKTFGTNLWSLRLASAACAWLTVLVLTTWGRRCFGAAVGVTAGLVLGTSFGFLYVHSGRSANSTPSAATKTPMIKTMADFICDPQVTE